MNAMLNFAGLVLATIFTAAIAVACNWLLLQLTFHLMQAAAVHQTTTKSHLARRAQLARVFASNR